MPWFYLSFATDEGFRGACVVEATDGVHAARVAHERGINPGGQVMAVESPDGTSGPFPTYRLLTKAELRAIDGQGESLGEMQARGVTLRGERVAMIHDGCNAKLAQKPN